jgi:hypothetical protein
MGAEFSKQKGRQFDVTQTGLGSCSADSQSPAMQVQVRATSIPELRDPRSSQSKRR